MIASPPAPGLSYVAVPQPDAPAPLRTDVAGFFGTTRRGPARVVADLGMAGTLTRVVGWRGYKALFGDVLDGLYTPYAVRGYFENGGEVAWICRTVAPGASVAKGTLAVTAGIASHGFEAEQYAVEATSPGAWAEGGTVKVRYRREGLRRDAEVDVVVRVDGEPVESFASVSPGDLVQTINDGSNLVRFTPVGPPPPQLNPLQPGPTLRDLPAVQLRGGSDGIPAGSVPPGPSAERTQYLNRQLAAVEALNDEEEVALLAAPDLYRDPWLGAPEEEAILAALLQESAALQDRLVLLDAPSPRPTVRELLDQTQRYRDIAELPRVQRAAAFYHPWLQIPLDPGTHPRQPFLELPPSGHVAGVISRLDRERGAHHTPANAPVNEAVDLSVRMEGAEQGLLHPAGVNLVRCMAGQGLQVWGSRTLDLGDPLDLRNGRFIAHRRLVHRIVRAARRVAQPLVFDVNGPELWLTIARAITSVLLQAYRAGALLGERPEEAFYVKCDAQNNPPEQIELGRCVCEIGVAPARPMEFIVLKVALLANGTLEVIE